MSDRRLTSIFNLAILISLASVPALFGVLAIYTIVIFRNRDDLMQRQLAENKLKQCLLALSEVSKT